MSVCNSVVRIVPRFQGLYNQNRIARTGILISASYQEPVPPWVIIPLNWGLKLSYSNLSPKALMAISGVGMENDYDNGHSHK